MPSDAKTGSRQNRRAQAGFKMKEPNPTETIGLVTASPAEFVKGNTRDTSQILVDHLPSMLAGAKVGGRHMGKPVLAEAISRLTRSPGGGKQTGKNQ